MRDVGRNVPLKFARIVRVVSKLPLEIFWIIVREKSIELGKRFKMTIESLESVLIQPKKGLGKVSQNGAT